MLLVILVSLLFISCETLDFQRGGDIDIDSPMGGAEVRQADNAKDPAKIDYKEDGVILPYNDGDELVVQIRKTLTGDIEKTITFHPKNSGTATLSNVSAEANTGNSYKDMTRELNVFLKNAKLIMWVGVGFLAAGGIFIGFLRDVRSGLILMGIGVVMLGGYAILPQLYTNWLLVLVLVVLVIPVYWFLKFKKHERVAKAAIKAHEMLKRDHPEIAKHHSKEFKQHLDVKDVEHARELKNRHERL